MPKHYSQLGGQKSYAGKGKDSRYIGNRGGQAGSSKDGTDTVVRAKTSSGGSRNSSYNAPKPPKA